MPYPPRATERFLAYSAREVRRRYWVKIFWIVALALFTAAALLNWMWWRPIRSAQSADIKYAWVQILPDGGRLARAIVASADRCPDITVEGVSRRMDFRPAPARAAFPILVCEAQINAGSPARIAWTALPSRADDPTFVVALGDTGCRTVYWTSQGCLNPNKWPFAAIAASAREEINQANLPSMVIHVGDYHYREHVCLDRSQDCGGSPYGDNWATWEEEFFKPAKPLLLAAPWVLLRGNHEDCNRAGAGWTFFFALPGQKSALRKSPDQPDKACESDLDSYSIAIGRTVDGRSRSLVVLDTANENDRYGLEDRCKIYSRWAEQLAVPKDEVWLALHQPLWPRNSDGSKSPETTPESPCMKAKDESGQEVIKTKSALDVVRARFNAAQPKRLARLVLTGDTHLFQFFQPGDGLPIQMVVGNGGTSLDELNMLGSKTKATSTTDDSFTSYGAKGSSLSVAQHGYTTLRREGWTWTVQMHDAAGGILVSCGFDEKPDVPQSGGCPVKPEKMRTAPSG